MNFIYVNSMRWVYSTSEAFFFSARECQVGWLFLNDFLLKHFFTKMFLIFHFFPLSFFILCVYSCVHVCGCMINFVQQCGHSSSGINVRDCTRAEKERDSHIEVKSRCFNAEEVNYSLSSNLPIFITKLTTNELRCSFI